MAVGAQARPGKRDLRFFTGLRGRFEDELIGWRSTLTTRCQDCGTPVGELDVRIHDHYDFDRVVALGARVSNGPG